MTAMMAFFLLMWLLGSMSKYDKQDIEDYFNTPPLSALFGNDGGASAHTSIINGGGESLKSARSGESTKTQSQPTPQQARATMQQEDQQRLQQLKQKLTTLIDETSALKAFKDQIRIAIMSEKACASRS